jgi:3'-phosphoadenosine 5'-phosphosulfate sulfotransferase (PAPS reductase)/FAD synthetase
MSILLVPQTIKKQLLLGAVVAISISGGKDSQALLKDTVAYMRKHFPTNKMFAIHADLGRVEWPQTMKHCKKLCKELGIELVVVRREKGDLLDRWTERMDLLEGTGKPFWSSAKNRYCTSDMKREPINKYLRKFQRVISVEGIRAQESTARAAKPVVKVRDQITTRERVAYTWNPILRYTIEHVYATYGMSLELLAKARTHYKAKGVVPKWWPFHAAYAMGNDRLSCIICVLASINDVLNGIRHAPELTKTLIKMEKKSGATFKHNMSLSTLLKRSKEEPQ